MNMLRNIVPGGLLACALLSSAVVLADEPQQTAAAQPAEVLQGALRVVDMVPSRSALDTLGINVESMLRAAVMDPTGSRYERQRALSFLAMYPSTETRAFLVGFIGNPEVDDVTFQRLALHTLALGFGQTPDDALLATIREQLVSPEREMRREAVRCLRWVASPDAVATLEFVLVSPDADATMRALATRSLENHTGVPVETGLEQ
jgi:hypothetical protein